MCQIKVYNGLTLKLPNPTLASASKHTIQFIVYYAPIQSIYSIIQTNALNDRCANSNKYI